MKRIFCIIFMLGFMAGVMPCKAEETAFSISSGEATLERTENGAYVTYTSGTPVLNYTMPSAAKGLFEVSFKCSLNAAQLKEFSAYSEAGTMLLYIQSARNIWGSTLENGWITKSVGYDISEYGEAEYRIIINADEKTYSLYIDDCKLISDFGFVRDGDNVKTLKFTFGEPIAADGAKAVISGLTVRNVSAEELEKEEFGEKTDIKYSENEKKAIYVSPTGSDSNNGTKELPFKTVAAAKEYAKQIKLNDGLPKKGIDIILRAGEYRENIELLREDSGTESAPIKFKAYDGEEVTITGMDKIAPELFEKVEEKEILERLPENARENIYKLSPKAAGIKNKIEISAMGQLGVKNASTAIITVNGEKAKVASWPNEGYAAVEKISEDGAITIDYENVSKWQDLSYAWMHAWVNGWYDASVRVKYDTDAAGIKAYNSLAHGGIKQGAKVRFVNILEELDEPGEWYLNPEEQIIYIWLEAAPKDSEIKITAEKENLLKIFGAEYVEFENINFEGTCANAVEANEAVGVKFAGCGFENIGKTAVEFNNCEKCVIKSCDIKNIGRGGVAVSGGEKETLKKAENYIINTHISNFAEETKTSAVGIKVTGVGNYVLNNLINGGEHTAISFAGNFNVIDKNEIYAVMTEADDAGAIYGGRSFIDRGNVISNNFIHGIEHGDGNNRMGVYLDDHLCGQTVTGNIVYDCNTAALLHGGRDNIVKNNTAVLCDQGIKAIDWTYKDYLDDESYSMWQALDASPYKSELWQKEFPHLYNIREDEPKEEKYNVVSGNLAVSCKSGNTASVNYANYSNVYDNLDTNDKSVISDIENFDFNINEASDVFLENAFLTANVYNEMGLYTDEYRTTFEKVGDFNLRYPQDKSENTESEKVTFYWEKAENAGEYLFTLAEDENFTKIVTEEKLYAKNYISVSGLKDNGCKYYWKVKAIMKTSNGISEKESEIFTFKTKIKAGTFYYDDFSDENASNVYSVGEDSYDKISVSDGKLVYERPSVGEVSKTGLYRDVDINLSEIRSEKLIIEYDVYPEKMRIDGYCYNFPTITDGSGKKYVDNYYDKTTKDLNSRGTDAVWHWHTFAPWNDESSENNIYKIRLEIDTENNKQSLYVAEVAENFEGEPEYKGYGSKNFASADTDGTIKRIYLARPESWNSVKILFDNFKVYENIAFEITDINYSDGAEFLTDTPKIDITFNSRVEESTLSNITLKNGEKNAAYKIIVNSENAVSLYFEKPLEWGADYILKIPKSVENIYHCGLAEEKEYKFSVRENPITQKYIMQYDNFNDNVISGYSWDEKSCEEVKAENGMLKYKRTNTSAEQLSGLKKTINTDMNKLPGKALTIEYDLYTYELNQKAGGTEWLMGFPEVCDENGNKYLSFYYESPDRLVKYFKTTEARKVGTMLCGDDVMYRVRLDLNFETGKYSALFKRFNTITGALEETLNIPEGEFLENTTGNVSQLTIIRGYAWAGFEIAVDNFTVYCDNSVLYGIFEGDNEVDEIEGNKEYCLNGEINNDNLGEFQTILAQYDENEKLINAFVIDSKSYNGGKVSRTFVSQKNTKKIKVFTWNEQKPVSGIYEWKEGIGE